MPLVTPYDMLHNTSAAVGAFNVALIEQLEAILVGAERARLPVIVQISENAVAHHGSLGPLAAAARTAVEAARVPAALHLDHATRPALIEEAVALGFTSVMYDGAALPWQENVDRTRRIARHCREHGVFLEAELGEVGGKDGAHAPGVRTDPGEAARFVADTGVDALAVAVGTSHHMTERTAHLDLDLVRELRAAVPVPLVLHGSSGADDTTLAAAAAAGIRKVNISTHLNAVFTAAVREVLDTGPDVVDPRRYVGRGREAMAAEVARLLRLFAAPVTAPAPA
ncbi:fructose-bisphosphate aldolase [Streptomyces alfalfae]|uniref:Fructose-bisphosphate aldolase n=1 Tax=Streptomyces alfalfae TaxID=1642299 RepID=A0ABM6H2E2_9ACTN|nr:class II fructose-bisphosphate aldolase [Streptomyces alfalfae]APY89866.1 fructose-bisphosphate aldolase [Streptomyces alfalfae]AYA20321.1 fructose-bisphosphate aldolase [Streptomyces fradiae]RXX42686.1 fructose-bisphosphate aldolase [Streptomyces alfalfae]RZM83119.1 fructose-bisphosphate aldolase [Streptomyces alfalfae]